MRISKVIQTIDTHTYGNPTRTVVSGIPPLVGRTMEEKREYFEKHFDWVRTVTMYEPRGSSAMSGAVLTTPCHDEADYGVIFIDSGGYFPMCGHSTIGVATMLIETGMVTVDEPVTNLVIDTPAGIVRIAVEVRENQACNVSFVNVPCFLYQTKELFFENLGPVELDVAYGGGSFVLVPTEPFGLEISRNFVPRLLAASHVVLEKANTEIGFHHPEKPEIKGIQQVHWYSQKVSRDDVHAKSFNVLLPGFDRSPCGTGTSARAVVEFVKGKIGINEEFAQESVTGGRFVSKILEPIEIGGFKGAIPSLSGEAHLTGCCSFLVDPNDPLGLGFEAYV